ncbi:redoxin domain-containing protein [Mangrovimonas spongiae]|uniref:Redoxin domain-containing protein n=1 Tax=Mangrovimonas spongiae TaxID=2494697 RepID=A0A3R9MEM3_9FLAO|nr:redoxin domain-containing protein [Mangrovimonas spongiae]RSK40282.1 redoxin domain-containing protein [Mangrovimonas spongiae]
MLKKIFYISILTLTIVACKNEPKVEGFLINGTIDASENGKKISLYKADRSNQVLLDSTRVVDGKITLEGKIDSPEIYLVAIEGNNQRLPIIVENTEMDLTLYKDSLMASKISGSKENDVFGLLQENMKPIRAKNAELMQQFSEARKNNDSTLMQTIRNDFEAFVATINDKNLAIVKDNPDLVIGASFLESMIKSKGIKVAEANEVFNAFTDKVKNSTIGKKLGEDIKNALKTAEGSMAPNFTAPNPEGEMITLNDIKGKVTIIDFWAAWCGPCRKENPNVVKVYNKYHEQGLEIIGVSLDGTPRQKDAKAAWVEAIEKDGLTWHQVSNLNYFNGPVAKQYNISSIPATFILDADGKIVAKNLRGKALEDKVAELLQ